MSTNRKGGRDARGGDKVDPKARRKQIIVGLVMGAVVGLVLSLLTEFWLWLPAGVAMGLATGAIMKPPPGR
ncbi:HPP family protein [Leucobacter sp. gxy201]|uniref:HPP family protein n=1 Tax=Leucobacter sp. gxy201 TaxID=2957200 RepID=UPI003DA152FE